MSRPRRLVQDLWALVVDFEGVSGVLAALSLVAACDQGSRIPLSIPKSMSTPSGPTLDQSNAPRHTTIGGTHARDVTLAVWEEGGWGHPPWCSSFTPLPSYPPPFELRIDVSWLGFVLVRVSIDRRGESVRSRVW